MREDTNLVGMGEKEWEPRWKWTRREYKHGNRILAILTYIRYSTYDFFSLQDTKKANLTQWIVEQVTRPLNAVPPSVEQTDHKQ